MSGREICHLMRVHRCAMRDLAQRTGFTLKLIREKRKTGLSNPNSVRDWVQAITGTDPCPVGA